MARGGFERPPGWAVIVMVVGIAFLAVGIPYAMGRNPSPSPYVGGPAATTAPAPVVAFIGDSYTAGTGATSPRKGFAADLSNMRGWQELDVGRGGTGYVTSVGGARAQVACGLTVCPSYGAMIAAAVAVHPTVVIVGGGRNDVSHASDADLPGKVAAFFASLRKALPHATIYATSPLWDATPAPAKLDAITAAIRSGVQAVGGTFVPIGQPLAGHPDLMSADGIHPNDAGHLAIAKALNAALPSGR